MTFAHSCKSNFSDPTADGEVMLWTILGHLWLLSDLFPITGGLHLLWGVSVHRCRGADGHRGHHRHRPLLPICEDLLTWDFVLPRCFSVGGVPVPLVASWRTCLMSLNRCLGYICSTPQLEPSSTLWWVHTGMPTEADFKHQAVKHVNDLLQLKDMNIHSF